MSANATPIRDPATVALLDRLHRRANQQLPGVVAHIASRGFAMLLGQRPKEDLDYYRDKLIPIDRNQGALIYLLCRSLNAARVVEYGTSFGVSTLYLASAVRDNGGGTVIGTELEAEKVQVARQNFAEAGLSAHVDLREGDALQTLADCGGPVDFLLVDGWPRLALSVLKLVAPQMRRDAIVVCDESGHAPSDRIAHIAASLVIQPVGLHQQIYRCLEAQRFQ